MSEFFPMDFFTQFHFMSPEWLVLIIPAIIFTGMMLRQILRSGDWSKYIYECCTEALEALQNHNHVTHLETKHVSGRNGN